MTLQSFAGFKPFVHLHLSDILFPCPPSLLKNVSAATLAKAFELLHVTHLELTCFFAEILDISSFKYSYLRTR